MRTFAAVSLAVAALASAASATRYPLTLTDDLHPASDLGLHPGAEHGVVIDDDDPQFGRILGRGRVGPVGHRVPDVSTPAPSAAPAPPRRPRHAPRATHPPR